MKYSVNFLTKVSYSVSLSSILIVLVGFDGSVVLYDSKFKLLNFLWACIPPIELIKASHHLLWGARLLF